MTKEEARLTLQANVIYACEVAKFDEATIGLVEEALDMAIEALTRLKGDWLSVEIIDDDSYNGVNEDATECSVCGYVGESYYWAKAYYKFCPNCGADMRGEKYE